MFFVPPRSPSAGSDATTASTRVTAVCTASRGDEAPAAQEARARASFERLWVRVAPLLP